MKIINKKNIIKKISVDNEWDDLDFFLNKALWSHRGGGKSISIRKRNLVDLKEVFKKEGLTFFLEGRTLENIYFHLELLEEDHDDDVGIFKKDIFILINKVIPALRVKGFFVIRANSDIVSIVRNDRYIDICIFKNKAKDSIGYGNKTFQRSYYEKLVSINFEGELFLMPCNTRRYLSKRYGAIITKLANFPHRSRIFLKNFTLMRNFVSIFRRTFSKNKVKFLNKNEFLELHIEPKGATNWTLRKPHMDIVTDNGKYTRVRDILKYLKNENNFYKSLNKVVEVDTSTPFKEEIHLDRRFWQSGNNFYIYCIKYQFRKNVVPYNEANKYIDNINTPNLYSDSYFNSLDEMNDDEIKELFLNSNLEVTSGAITGGRHRMYAMIGRIASGKKYIPCSVSLR